MVLASAFMGHLIVNVCVPASVATLKAAHFTVRSTPGIAFDDFIINSSPQQQASHKELLNPLLRQAFDHAINRQAVVATSLLGHGQPGSTIIPPATGQWSDPSIKPVPFSLATANQGGRLLFRPELGAGAHVGPAGRSAHLRYEAGILAFILDEAGIPPAAGTS
jgi:hypothetical protein